MLDDIQTALEVRGATCQPSLAFIACPLTALPTPQFPNSLSENFVPPNGSVKSLMECCCYQRFVLVLVSWDNLPGRTKADRL